MVTLIKPRREDQVEAELAAVDLEFREMYGPEHLWEGWQRDTYLAAIARARHTKDFTASRAAGFTETADEWAARVMGGAS